MMRITELLKQESIGLNVSVSTKEEAMDKLVDLMAAGGRLKDKAGYKEGILAREALGSTGIGGGIAGRTLNKRMSSRAVDKLFLVLMGIIILISIYNAVHYMGV
mgnify:CR=1 FL=1